MASKILVALVTVLIGIGVAFAVYWLLNKFAELLPGRAEHRVKPYLYILPAYIAITIYLIYPAIQTIIDSFRDQVGEDFVGFENYQELLTSEDFRATLYNTFLWILIVPVASRRHGPRGRHARGPARAARRERGRRPWSSCRWRSASVGASVVWNFVYESRPAGQPAGGPAQRVHRRVRLRPGRLARGERVPPQQPAADDGAALVAGGLLHGPAVRGGQGRADRHPRGGPHRRRRRDARSSSRSSSRRSRARSSRSTSR